jgi:peptide/nickel transport system substrate-binding protein
MLSWLLAPAAYVLPKDLPASYDFAKGSRGTGPFVLETWNGSTAGFRAHEGYWGTIGDKRLPFARSLSISVIKDASVQLLAFSRGELDVLNIPVALFGAVFGSDGKLQARWSDDMLRETPLNDLKFIAFRMGTPPWGTREELRQKVSRSIDRDAIVRDLFRGHARAAHSVIPSGMPE